MNFLLGACRKSNDLQSIFRQVLRSLFVLLFGILWLSSSHGSVITDIQPLSEVAEVAGQNVLIFRKYLKDGKPHALAANLDTLNTFVVPLSEVKFITISEKWKLLDYIKNKIPIQKIDSDGYTLTIDLCQKPRNPSRKFENGLFLWLSDRSKEKKAPIPVAIAITKLWKDAEMQNFRKLVKLKKDGFLKITWINHSATHPINDGKFLTLKGVDFESEVLNTEKMLLEEGEVPSIFFRFPGLIYNDDLLEKLSKLSLIPLDANAWLEKGQKIHPGSIILVHGNGNEAGGIEKLELYFKNIKPNFKPLLLPPIH